MGNSCVGSKPPIKQLPAKTDNPNPEYEPNKKTVIDTKSQSSLPKTIPLESPRYP